MLFFVIFYQRYVAGAGVAEIILRIRSRNDLFNKFDCMIGGCQGE